MRTLSYNNKTVNIADTKLVWNENQLTLCVCVCVAIVESLVKWEHNIIL